jgi:hypothetical protein
MYRFVLLIAGLCLVSWLAVSHSGLAIPGVNTTKISTLVASPDDYQGKHVTTIGIVVNRVGFLGYGKYSLHDLDNDTVVDVITDKAVPALGSRVTVTGTFKQAFALGTVQIDVIVAD